MSHSRHARTPLLPQLALFFLSFLTALFVAAGPAAAVSYTISDLGTLPGTTASSVLDINNAGQIVGNSGSTGFLWESGAMQSLGTLPGAGSSTANRINNIGQVVGSSGNFGYLWQGGTMQNVGTLPGATSSSALGLNDLGHVVGSSGGSAFLWQGGTMQALAPPAGPGYSGLAATGINNLGQIAGTSNWSAPCANCNRTYGLLWQTAASTPTTFLAQNGFEERTGVARINEAGWLVGSSSQTEPIERLTGYVRRADGTITNFQFANASGLNNLGEVVGNNTHGPSPMGPFLWSEATGMQPVSILNGTGWSGLSLVDINDHGWIIGNGTFNGFSRGFLLMPHGGPGGGAGGGGAPVPEPGTLLLVGSGLAALRRRRIV